MMAAAALPARYLFRQYETPPYYRVFGGSVTTLELSQRSNVTPMTMHTDLRVCFELHADAPHEIQHSMTNAETLHLFYCEGGFNWWRFDGYIQEAISRQHVDSIEGIDLLLSGKLTRLDDARAVSELCRQAFDRFLQHQRAATATVTHRVSSQVGVVVTRIVVPKSRRLIKLDEEEDT
jgi:hypothetical protein